MHAYAGPMFSAALCRGLIEARKPCPADSAAQSGGRIPRLYAAASLKPQVPERLREVDVADAPYFAALCRRPH